jgi:hypothetical protein
MPRRSYLSPQFRNLRTEQIGPSSHKNEFRSGVLVGNWSEDRLPRATGLGGAPSDNLPPLGSTHSQQFTDKSRAVPSQTMQKTPDMGRELMFGHNPHGAPTAASETNVPPKEVKRFQEKRAAWREEVDPDAQSRMKTTKKAEMDRVGDLVQRDHAVLEECRATATMGRFTGAIVNDHVQSGLRTPYPMHNTPLVRR